METLSTKVPPSIKERIEEYAEEIEETRSTAIRELLVIGLESEETDRSPSPWILAQLLGWVLFAGAFVDIAPVAGYVGAGIILLTIIESRYALTDQF